VAEYEIDWAVGGRVVVTAETADEAHDQARDLLPRGGDWMDLNVSKVDEN
jgi:hypothetical protein